VVYEFPSRALVHLPQYVDALPTRQAQSPFNGLDPSKPELDAVYISPIQVCALLQSLPSPLWAQANGSARDSGDSGG
jgi:hypothetical protein